MVCVEFTRCMTADADLLPRREELQRATCVSFEENMVSPHVAKTILPEDNLLYTLLDVLE